MPHVALFLAVFLTLVACSREDSAAFHERVGTIEERAVDEASGLHAGVSNPDALFLHNDDGTPRLFVIDGRGRDLGSVRLEGAFNRDWEDLTAVPAKPAPLLVVGDIGDNFARRKDIALYFVAEPEPDSNGRYGGAVPLTHRLALRYPDGPRDCESLAFDPVGRRLLLLTKRDVPPRIYAIDLERALKSEYATLEYLGESHRFRPPSPADLRRFGARDRPWAAQPTGLDISRDGSRAAVISYRSLYVFERNEGEDWLSALARVPHELQAPPSPKEEAVTFQGGDRYLFVTTEGTPAPLYRLELPPP